MEISKVLVNINYYIVPLEWGPALFRHRQERGGRPGKRTDQSINKTFRDKTHEEQDD